MLATSSSLTEVFAARGWLAGQPAGFRDAVLACSRRRELDPGEPIFHAGDAPGGVFGVIGGGIGAWRCGRSDTPALTTIVRRGDWFGMGPVLSLKPRTLTFQAMEPSSVLLLTLAALAEMQTKVPETTRRLGALAVGGLETISDIVSDLLLPGADRRIAAVLLRVTAVEEGVTPDHPHGFLISQRELGEMANASRSQINATLGKFRRSGWISTHYNRIALLDPAALHRCAAAG